MNRKNTKPAKIGKDTNKLKGSMKEKYETNKEVRKETV